MLGPSTSRRLDQPIAVSLEDLVPAHRFYRHLETNLDLSFVREWTRELYAERGRPSIDPVVFFKGYGTPVLRDRVRLAAAIPRAAGGNRMAPGPTHGALPAAPPADQGGVPDAAPRTGPGGVRLNPARVAAPVTTSPAKTATASLQTASSASDAAAIRPLSHDEVCDGFRDTARGRHSAGQAFRYL